MNKSSVYLRYIEVKDAELVLEWDSPYSIYDILVLIGELQNVSKAKQARWMICLSENDKAIGNVDLTEIDFNKMEATIGILIACKEYRRKGFASKAIKLIESKAVALNLKKLHCSVHKDNIGSCNLFIKNKFMKIGEKLELEFKGGAYIDILLLEKWLKK